MIPEQGEHQGMEPGMSAAATALLLLTWQEPSDRALKGWSPYPGLCPGTLTEVGLTMWLKDHMRTSMAEVDDLARLRAVD